MMPQYNTKLFCEIWDNHDDFLNDYNNLGIPTTISNENATTLFYLLYAKFANNPISNYDIEQWKYKVFSIVWQFGPTWEKKLSIQKTLRDLTENELLAGSKAIYNKAFNPNTSPSADTDEFLDYINEQNTTNYKRNKIEAYGLLWELLKDDVTSSFLTKFTKLFLQIVKPAKPLIFVTDLEEREPE